jgi:hypothetical protein
MIYNILDERERRFRWEKVNAVVESTSCDNGVRDSDQATLTDDLLYSYRDGISLREAIAWANNLSESVTLYIYDTAPDAQKLPLA